MLTAKLLELRYNLGTTTAVADEVQLDERTVRQLINKARRASRCSKHTINNIEKAWSKVSRVLPDDCLHYAREALNRAKADRDREILERHLVMLNGFLTRSQPDNVILFVQHTYLRIMVCMSMALHAPTNSNRDKWFGGRNGWEKALRDGERLAQQWFAARPCAEGLTDDEAKVINRLEPFIFINWVQIVQEQQKAGYINSAGQLLSTDDVKQFLKDQNAIEKLRKFLCDYPFLWQAAYNGLELSSTLKQEHDDDALWFYKKLKRIDPGFCDFGYAPPEVKSLFDEPGMAFFVENHPELHTPVGLDDNDDVENDEGEE